MQPEIVALGEGMLELAMARSRDTAAVAYGGDTLNTAVHLSRAGRHVAFATALGIDGFSDRLFADWAGEGLDTTLILRDPARLPGLYAIECDADGERSFSYWRSDSAARQLFALPGSDRLIATIERCPVLLFSLISIAILPAAGREALLDLASGVRARGGMVVFDGNYRPRLWRDAAEAAAMRDRALEVAQIGLPTLEDEAALAGRALAAEDVAAHWSGYGVAEVAVKLGAAGCLVDGVVVAPPARLSPIDTSGAGDSFNAGYLDARLAGASPVEAARAGHRLAGWTLMHPGGIPARTADAPYPEPHR